jgi:hypothetical protein
MPINVSISILAIFLIFIPLLLTFIMYPFYKKTEILLLLVSFSLFCFITMQTGELWGFIILISISWSVAINSVMNVRNRGRDKLSY